jgi:hypothetical protein
MRGDHVSPRMLSAAMPWLHTVTFTAVQHSTKSLFIFWTTSNIIDAPERWCNFQCGLGTRSIALPGIVAWFLAEETMFPCTACSGQLCATCLADTMACAKPECMQPGKKVTDLGCASSNHQNVPFYDTTSAIYGLAYRLAICKGSSSGIPEACRPFSAHSCGILAIKASQERT